MAHAAKYAASASGHMLSHYDRSKDGLSGNIDPSRTHLNYNLGPEREGSQLDFIHQRMSEVRCLKRADVNIMCDWVVTLPQYQWHDNNIHMTPNKEQVERTFFERVYRFMADRYGEQNIISAYVHRDETTPHIHFAFVPVTEDKKRGGEKLSAKEVVTRKDLQTFHTDLERHLDSFRDWHFEVVNEATKDGNKTIAELKKQTAHEEVLKAQQEATEARQRALQEQESIKSLVEQKNALKDEIEALQTEKEILTATEVEAIKGEKNLLGGLKGVTYKEFEAVKRTAAAVESMTAERDQALARAERADLRATAAEAKVKTAYEDANRQLQVKIREVEQDRPSMKAQMEIVQLRKENQTLQTENSSLRIKVADLEAMVRRLGQIIREKLPEVYA
ncbi:MobV family relaxase, partial [Clostridioides difficile]|uniref:MobV family relaxase n=1 Tax=Clostridioides difficile TaxID=1496 RepID=UPI0031B5A7D9